MNGGDLSRKGEGGVRIWQLRNTSHLLLVYICNECLAPGTGIVGNTLVSSLISSFFLASLLMMG